jgi:hypothetical protein
LRQVSSREMLRGCRRWMTLVGKWGQISIHSKLLSRGPRPHLASFLRYTSCTDTTPVHETHICLVMPCMQAGRTKQTCETTLQARLQASSTLRQVAGSPSKRRMWHFRVELLRLGLLLLTLGIANALPPQTNSPRQSTVIEWLP